MSGEAMVITLISAIISGILATVITLYIGYKNEQMRIKKDLVDDVFGYRYQISGNYQGDKSGINRALNRVPIVFNKHTQVLSAYDNLHNVSTMVLQPAAKSEKMDDAFVTLYKEMCIAAKIEVKNWNDSKHKAVKWDIWRADLDRKSENRKREESHVLDALMQQNALREGRAVVVLRQNKKKI